MATQIQTRRGTTTQHSSFTGAAGEITVDTDKNTVVVHDGSTAGGHAIEAGVNSVNTQTGSVVLDADDIDDTSTTHKFATAAQLTDIGTAVQPGDLATVATSGSYNDLSDQPTIPAAAPVDSVNTQTGAVVLDADDIDDASTSHKFVTAAQITSIGTATQPGDLATVATSGDYDDLTNKPTLGTAAATASTAYATSTQGATADSAVQPGDLATVATSGDYDDLTNKPTSLEDNSSHATSLGVGTDALTSETATGNSNAAFGTEAGTAIDTGDRNCAFGYRSLFTNISGLDNTGLGNDALQLATGSNNTGVGSQAGDQITTGSNNTCIGFEAQPSSATVSNEITLGHTTVTKLRVPGINFTLKDNGGTPTEGQVLTTDSNGEGYWTDVYTGAVTAVAALAIDCSSSNYFTKTINANSTFTFTNVPATRAFSFTLELTHTSGTVTWPASVKFPADTAPSLTTGKTHLFMFITDDGGTTFRGASLVDYTN